MLDSGPAHPGGEFVTFPWCISKVALRHTKATTGSTLVHDVCGGGRVNDHGDDVDTHTAVDGDVGVALIGTGTAARSTTQQQTCVVDGQ